MSRSVSIAILCTILISLMSCTQGAAQNQTWAKVGVSGDDASIGNAGVQAEIRTHYYDTYPTMFDYFWIGTLLEDGAMYSSQDSALI